MSVLFFSTKYTGVFTFLTVGFLTGRDLWKLIGDHKLPSVSTLYIYISYIYMYMLKFKMNFRSNRF